MNDGLLSKGILILAPMKYRAKFPENMFRKKMLSHKINAIFQHRDKKVVQCRIQCPATANVSTIFNSRPKKKTKSRRTFWS